MLSPVAALFACIDLQGRVASPSLPSSSAMEDLDGIDAALSVASSNIPIWNAPAKILQSTIFRTLTLRGVQRLGENIFGAMFIVACLQAMVTLAQYRTNPMGQLIAPPGLTHGVALPSESTTLNESKELLIKQVEEDVEVDASLVNKTKSSTATSRYTRIINRINRWLVLAIPWVSRKFGFVMTRNTHLFHVGLIFTLAGFFDIPNRWNLKGNAKIVAKTDVVATDTTFQRVVVIGDSLAVGMGTVNIFDKEKDNSVPYSKIENVKDDFGPGPVFPRALAETLATHSQASVQWRSAGVDGGDAAHIQHFCLDIIEEEVANGRFPDVVVILCGMNDLKNYISNPFRYPGPRTFRTRLKGLIAEIKKLAPNTKVVLPSVPTQMFRKNSPLNVIPLNFFLDTIVGFWDSQKKLVADLFPSRDVMYFFVTPGEVFDWYKVIEEEADAQEGGDSLIAADGIHPNAKCYAMWASSLGKKLLAAVNCKPRLHGTLPTLSLPQNHSNSVHT